MDQFLYFLLHKPVGIESSRISQQSSKTVWDIVDKFNFPTTLGLVGRLDKETSGIMLMTNDRYLTAAIRDPSGNDSEIDLSLKEKEYFVRMIPNKALQRDYFQFIQNISATDSKENPLKSICNIKALENELSQPFSFQYQGITYETNPAKVTILRRYQDPQLSLNQLHLGWVIEFSVQISEGKHHQIRRMANRVGFKVIELTRTKIADILRLDSIPIPGHCRWLTEEEILLLRRGLVPHLDYSLLTPSPPLGALPLPTPSVDSPSASPPSNFTSQSFSDPL